MKRQQKHLLDFIKGNNSMDYTYSVSIPHYNSPLLLQRMLNSIPERDDLQIIVVDDGSNECYRDELRKIQRKNLETIFLNENHGGGYARNVGLQHAKGKWFISVDSDDFFSNNAFEIFDKYKHEDVDVLMFCINTRDERGMIVRHPLRSNESVLAYLKENNEKTENRIRYLNPDTWNKLVSMKFIKDNDIRYENCRINIDAFYALQIGYFAKSIIAIPDKLYNWVITDGSITMRKRSVEREFQFFLQAQKRNGFYKQIGLTSWPYYRKLILYIPYMLKKRGVLDTISFFYIIYKNWNQVKESRKSYLYLFDK